MKVTFPILMLLLMTAACEQKKETAQVEPQSTATATATTSTPTMDMSASATVPENKVDAELTIVKFSDYQCPACKYYKAFVDSVKKDFGDRVEVIYKHFPLNMHPYALLAARSAEAAKKQHKFQEMHELIFMGQEQWSRGNAEAIFLGYAGSLNLDMKMFRNDMNSAEMQRIVMEDKREGLNLGVDSTPTFFIDGVKLETNPRYYSEFKPIIEQALAD